jgi:SAM-dependent methyltransferase
MARRDRAPAQPEPSGELPERLERWRAELAEWAIPEPIRAAAAESPWVLPRQVFARRAERVAAAPAGPSFELAWAALDPPGSVLDVGSGAGAACLPLLPRCISLTAVDVDPEMLSLLAERAARLGGRVRQVPGGWPEVAAEAGPADVVTCHHVCYNVPEIAPFLAALTASARRLVVVEVTERHPLTVLNPLWLSFHGIARPDGPAAADLMAIVQAMGMRPRHQRWRRPGGADYASFAELVDVTRRRLCLPPDRADEVGAALVQAGTDPANPADLGSSGREVVTISWAGTAIG